jgi:hypothetical protein
LPEEYVVLGDPAFCGNERIRSTYSSINNQLTRQEEYELGAQRVIIENTFGLFKGKFNRFKHTICNKNIEKTIRLVKGSMWIHNFLIDDE